MTKTGENNSPINWRALYCLAALVATIYLSLLLSPPSSHLFSQESRDKHQIDSLKQEGGVLVATQCAGCHTLDLVASQRLTRGQWEKVVNKMIGWGSTLDSTRINDAVAFLSAFYTPSTTEADTVLLNVPIILSTGEISVIRNLKGNPKRGRRLYKQMCVACHEDPKEGVIAGTVLEDNPLLRAEESFWGVVLNGRNEMPSFRGGATNQEIADILAWLKTTY